MDIDVAIYLSQTDNYDFVWALKDINGKYSVEQNYDYYDYLLDEICKFKISLPEYMEKIEHSGYKCPAGPTKYIIQNEVFPSPKGKKVMEDKLIYHRGVLRAVENKTFSIKCALLYYLFENYVNGKTYVISENRNYLIHCYKDICEKIANGEYKLVDVPNQTSSVDLGVI